MSEIKETRGRGRPATGETPSHKLICPDALWQEMVTAAAANGTSLSAATRDFYRWYTRQPFARMPDRP